MKLGDSVNVYSMNSKTRTRELPLRFEGVILRVEPITGDPLLDKRFLIWNPQQNQSYWCCSLQLVLTHSMGYHVEPEEIESSTTVEDDFDRAMRGI